MQVIKFLFILIVVFVLVVLVMNQSISSYLEQKYHIIFYPQNDILNEANALKVKLEQVRMILSNESISAEFETEKEENLNFETAMKQLEEIANQLERNDLDLDKAVEKFEEGMKLSKKCNEILENAEKKITILINDGKDNFSEEEFNTNKE